MKQILSILILVALALPLPAQQLYVGANWHPHDLTSDEISRDIRLMQEAGFNVVRLGHLAWDSYEPREGEYSFAWFDPVLDQCEAAGIKVILDIPVRPAPMWLHKKYPGVNIVDGRGGITYPNHRYMQDVGDPDYQRCALALTEAMTARYGSHPAVIGFGLDNEAASGATSYSEYVRKRFVSWLERKYGTTDALNTAWAGQRWSRRLSDFDEVVLPNGNGQPEKRLDFQRFISDEVNGFYIKMLDIIERNAPGAQTYSNCWYYADGKPYDYAPFVYTGRMTRGGAGIYPGSLLSSDVHSTLFGIRVGKFMDTASVKELAGLSANDRNMTVNYKGSPIHVQAAYFDIIEPRGATVTGTLSGIDSERPIITENRYGLGRAIFVGLAETPAYLSVLLDEMIGQLGIRRAPEVPTGVQVRRIDEQHFLYFNSTPNPQNILVGRPSRSLLHDVRLDASFTLSPYEPEFIEIR